MKQWDRRSFAWLAGLIVMLAVLLTGCGNVSEEDSSSAIMPSSPAVSGSGQTEERQQSSQAPGATKEQEKQSQAPLTGFKEVSAYIREHHKLPPNFITKKEAEQLGWVAAKGNLNDAAPGKSIGGDRFGNREGLLPKAKNRIWYEADIHYKKGPRGADRILYSSDGLIYMTIDHYKSFTDITKEGSVPE